MWPIQEARASTRLRLQTRGQPLHEDRPQGRPSRSERNRPLPASSPPASEPGAPEVRRQDGSYVDWPAPSTSWPAARRARALPFNA